VSRNLLDIGERNRHMEEGFGLVAARNNPMNLREKEYFLTDKGRALLHSITRQLYGTVQTFDEAAVKADNADCRVSGVIVFEAEDKKEEK
jgi:hypothetical protein